MHQLKIYMRALCYDNRECAIFEEELTCLFKIDKRSLTNFDPSTQKFQEFGI